VPLAEVRKRASRIERIDVLRDPANYASPSLEGRVTFRYKDHRDYTVGHGEYEFKIDFSGRGSDSVYVHTDSGLKALGLITSPNYNPLTVDSFLRPGRTAEPVVGQSVVLMNFHGTLCIITINEVQSEVNAVDYIPEHVTFTYKILME